MVGARQGVIPGPPGPGWRLNVGLTNPPLINLLL
jgi:hypothetical protein